MEKDDSKCKKDILCKFEISRNLDDALIEICENCGKKIVYYKRNGLIDDRKYARDHKRDLIQPYGKDAKLFYKFYGNESVKRAIEWQGKKINKIKRKEIREELMEKRMFIMSKVSGKKIEPIPLIKRIGSQIENECN